MWRLTSLGRDSNSPLLPLLAGIQADQFEYSHWFRRFPSTECADLTGGANLHSFEQVKLGSAQVFSSNLVPGCVSRSPGGILSIAVMHRATVSKWNVLWGSCLVPLAAIARSCESLYSRCVVDAGLLKKKYIHMSVCMYVCMYVRMYVSYSIV